jgi:hypothetical protein
MRTEPLEPPTEPGMVRYVVEVMPHDWANDGLAWESGTQSPADVARALRSIADQVEYFTAPAEVKP